MSAVALPTRPRGGQRTATYVKKACLTCKGVFEVREKMAARQSNCPDCREFRFPSFPGGYCVATAQLAPVIEEIVRRRDAIIRKTELVPEDQGTGVVEALAQDIAATLKQKREGVYRQIYRVRYQEGRVTSTEFADALLLADGRLIEQEDITVYPCNLRSAREMEEIAAEDRGEILSKLELDQRAQARFNAALEEVAALAGR